MELRLSDILIKARGMLPRAGESTEERRDWALRTVLRVLKETPTSDVLDPATLKSLTLGVVEGKFVRACLKVAHEVGLVPPLYMHIRVPRVRRVISPPPLPEISKAVWPMRMGPLKIALLLGIYCGLRIGEVCRLRWEDVDLENGRIYVRNSKNGSGRIVRVPSQIVRTLSEWKGRCRSQWVTNPKVTSLRSRVRKFMRKRGLGLRYHDLRHAHATWLISSGVDVAAVSARLGHSSPKTTFEFYVHAVPWAQESAVKLLEEVGP